MIYVVTGGERAGKSRFAQDLALRMAEHPVYLATARVWDADFQRRIDRHRSDRGPEWVTREEEKFIGSVDVSGEVAVVDCLTLWLTNIFTDAGGDVESTLVFARREWDALRAMDATLIVVTNELGMGVHAQTEAGRKFVEVQGWMNQYVASCADTVVLMVSGIPVAIKQPQAGEGAWHVRNGLGPSFAGN